MKNRHVNHSHTWKRYWRGSQHNKKVKKLLTVIKEIDRGSQHNKKVKKLLTAIKEIDKENDVEIAFSGIIHSEDLRDSKEMIDDTNK